MKKIELKTLKKVAKELNVFLEYEKDDNIDVKLPQAKLEAGIIEGFEDLVDNELSELSKMAQEVHATLMTPAKESKKEEKKAPKKEKKEKKKETKVELSLMEMVEEAEDLDALKALVKEDDTFKSIRKGIGFRKGEDALRKEMIALATGPVENETPKKDKKKDKAEKQPEDKVEKSEIKKEDKPKVKKNKDEKGASYYVRYFTCKNPKITVDEIAEKIAEKGFTQSKASINIRRGEMIKAIEIMTELKKLK